MLETLGIQAGPKPSLSLFLEFTFYCTRPVKEEGAKDGSSGYCAGWRKATALRLGA